MIGETKNAIRIELITKSMMQYIRYISKSENVINNKSKEIKKHENNIKYVNFTYRYFVFAERVKKMKLQKHN